jgi:GT2 family glycosyltransferase
VVSPNADSLPTYPRGISAIVCTRDRFEIAQRHVLDAVARLRIPSEADFELILVENGNDVRLEQWAATQRMPFAVKFLREPIPGLSRARNSALKLASLSHVAFWDDDCEPSSDYLTTLAPRLGEPSDPRWLCVRVRSHYLDAPKWFAPDGRYACWSYLGNFDPGTDERLLAEPTPISCAMVLPRAWFERYGAFDQRLGEGTGTRAEDSDLAERLLAAGLRYLYLPQLTVEHYPVWGHRSRAKILQNDFLRGGRESSTRDARLNFGWMRRVLSHTVQASLFTVRNDQPASLWHARVIAKMLGGIASQNRLTRS